MEFALVSDIHGNLEALEAVLADIEKRGIKKIHSLGDVIGYGCDPIACLDLVAANCEIKLMGNHEYAALGKIGVESMNDYARHSLNWTEHAMTDHEVSMIADFTLEAEFEGCRLLHSSPYQPDQWHYVLSSDDANLAFECMEHPIAFNGHTHVPVIFSISQDDRIRAQAGHDFDPDEESRYIVNVGSVGQPRDNDPRACYVVVETDPMTVLYHRVEYDIKKTQAKMAEARMPRMLIERLEIGR